MRRGRSNSDSVPASVTCGTGAASDLRGHGFQGFLPGAGLHERIGVPDLIIGVRLGSRGASLPIILEKPFELDVDSSRPR